MKEEDLTFTATSSKTKPLVRVTWSPFVDKQLDRIPEPILRKFHGWIATLEKSGIQKTRMLKGLHDEPLKGKREGQRSIRLNRSYRVIYIELDSNEIELIHVLEVNKHEY